MVLAERGLDARWRLRRSTRLGWPPFGRLTPGGTLRPQGSVRAGPLKTLGPEPGTTWPGTGSACQGRPRQLPCPRRACGAPGSPAPGLLLPDWPPAASPACGDGWRAWMEQGCTSPKRAGGQGQRPRLPLPERAARLGLAVAVAT
jgi:hypothetical protein